MTRVQFDLEVAATDTDRRMISGVAVPWGHTASLGGTTYTFERGSLRPARSRTPLLLSHDTDKPVGVLVNLHDGDDGAHATFRVDDGPDGDLALVQAASGSRGGLSVGAEIITAEADESGRVSVSEAAIFEVSLVAIPAFEAAAVLSVAASADPDPDPDPAVEPEEETPVSDQPEATPADETTEVEASVAPIYVKAERDLGTPGDYIAAMIRAQRGDRQAVQYVEAALSDLNTTGEPGLVPPQYVQRLLGELPDNRPLASGAVTRATLPASGMKIIKPIVTTPAAGSWVAEGAATPSNAYKVDLHETSVKQWAYGVSLSLALMERGEGAAESVYRSAILAYHADVESAIMTEIAFIAPIKSVASAGAGKIMEDVGLGSAEVYKHSGLRPNAVLMGPDTWAKLLPVLGPLAYTSGSTSAATIAGSLSGLDVIVTPEIGNSAIYVLNRSAIELREGSPIQLRANVIGTMQIELGVSAFMTLDVENPNAICRVGADPTK